jgi:hypothetical protein
MEWPNWISRLRKGDAPGGRACDDTKVSSSALTLANAARHLATFCPGGHHSPIFLTRSKN